MSTNVLEYYSYKQLLSWDINYTNEKLLLDSNQIHVVSRFKADLPISRLNSHLA